MEFGDQNTVITDYALGTTTYRTIFLPDLTSIDTFYTDFKQLRMKIDITDKYLKNTKSPFVHAAWDGTRWGNLQDWITNKSVRTKGGNLYGGYDNLNGSNSFGVEQWTTDASILDGKIYQTFTIAPGKYQFVFSFRGGNLAASNTGTDPRYMVVAVGNSLPNTNNISSALASASLVGVETSDSKMIEFSIEQEAELSLGIVVNFTSKKQNIRADHIQLMKID